MTPERVKRGLPLLLGDALTLFCLLAGGLGCVLPLNRFDMGGGTVIAVCALLSIGSAALHTWRHGSWTALGLLGAEALILWRKWDAFEFAQWLGGAELRNDFLEFFVLAFAFALLLGWVVVRARCWYLAALAVTVPILPAIVGGILPDWTALTAAALGWGTMLLTALYDHRDRASFGKGVLLSMAGLAALLLGLTAALPQEGYTRPQWATDARDSVIDTVSKSVSSWWDWDTPEFLEEYLGIEGSGGGWSEGGYRIPVFAVAYPDGGAYVNLRAAGPRRYADNTVMEIRGGEAGWSYLWGGSAAVYTGESWEDVAPEACYILRDMMNEQLELGGAAEPALFPAMTAPAAERGVMIIRHTYPGGTTAFYPYRPVYFLTVGVDLCSVLTMGMDIPGETRAVKDSGVEEYQVAYRPGGPLDGYSPLSGDAAVAERIYRDFVYANCFDVPQEARDALSPLLERIGTRIPNDIEALDVPEQWREVSAAARQTAAVLNAAAVYDLNTPVMEEGEDFVAQFLDRGRGYCIHFATAGALLLRMQGIPARYASGYAFHADENGAAEVKDSSAHAWVEIYLAGYGWYPVEMTPGFSDGAAAPDGADPYVQAEDLDRFAPDERERPERPDEPDTPGDEPEEDEPSAAPEQEEQTSGTGTAEGKEPLNLSWLRPLLSVLLAASVPAVLFRLGTRLRRRSREKEDTNGSVINAYVRYRRVLAWGGKEVPVLEELARKAGFSQHTLTAEERETAWESLEEAVQRLIIVLPWWKRAVFRCLKPLF